ncbi:hypothetical protein GCM10027610_049900 [Dactylosporangium cerinum]
MRTSGSRSTYSEAIDDIDVAYAPPDRWGAQTPADDACYHETRKNVIATDTSVLSRAWLDTAHRKSLTDPTPMHVVRVRRGRQDTAVAYGSDGATGERTRKWMPGRRA